MALIPLEHFASWLASGERGISSEAIVSQLTGQPVGRSYRGDDHPYDPADYRRCEKLLTAYPAARLQFSAMRDRSEVWARMVDHWDEIGALIKSEAPRGGWAPAAYALMRRLCEPEQGGR